MKKIISLLSAFAIVLTTVASLTTVAFAENEQTLSCSVAYPVDMDGDTYVEVTVKASGFEYAKYNSLKKTYAGLTGIQFELDYDSEVLTYVAGIEGDAVSEPQIGEAAPKFAVGKDVKYVIDGTDSVLVTFYFMLNDSFDVNAQSTEIGFVADSVLMQLEKNGVDAVKYGDHVEATTPMTITGCTLGTAAPAEPEEPEEPVAQSVQTAVFEPAVGDYVEVTLSDDNGQKGDAVKFSLPDNVKGKAKVLGFLKYTIGEAGDGRETPAAGDTLTAVLKSISDTAKAVTILTEKVK